MLHGKNKATRTSTRRVSESGLNRGPEVDGARYGHIVVPTRLSLDDREALLLGLELRSAHAAALTVLHVAPPVEGKVAPSGLDAISLLHAAAHESPGLPLHGQAETAQPQIHAFVEQIAPGRLQEREAIQVECRHGQVAASIAQFAEEADADLVIVSSRLPSRWLPVYSTTVRRLLRLTQRPLLVVPRQGRIRTPFRFAG